MLNEIRELEAYLTKPNMDRPRIQPYLFTDSFSDGKYLAELDQILNTIARGFIYSSYDKEQIYIPEGLIHEKIMMSVMYILQRWCGFQDVIRRIDCDDSLICKWFERYPEADGWLKNYWMYHFEKKEKPKKTKKKKTAEQLWNEIETYWSKGLNSDKDFRFKSITYKNVIANALEMGELKERYLVFRKDLKSATSNEKNRFNYLFEVAPGTSKPQITTKMKFLKNIAAYLILRELHPDGQKEVLLKRGQLLGWYGQDDTKNDNKIWYLENFFWKNEPIFSRNEKGNTFIKLQIKTEYIEYFDFKVILKSEVMQLNEREKYWILEDCGHGLESCWTIK